MLTLIIGALTATACAFLATLLLDGWFFPGLAGVAGFLAVTVPLNLWVKRRLEAIFQGIQSKIGDNQAVMQRKVNMMANKMMSSTKGIQRQIEKQQVAVIKEALNDLDCVGALQKWNLLAERQSNTLRGQLCFQIREFDKADTYFERSLAFDPLTVAMKMTRAYKKDDLATVEKLFKRGKRRFKGEKGALIYALYAWILLKQDRVEDAIPILEAGKDKTEDVTLRTNWEHLVNGRPRSFSNAGLGDMWYALQLETPKAVRAKQRGGGHRR